jgi:putative ABC transport system permease protein
VILENFLLGFIGGAVGVVLGVALAYAVSAVGIPMPPPPNADLGYTAYIRVTPGSAIGAFSVGLVVTVLASLLPAARAARMHIIDALRQGV